MSSGARRPAMAAALWLNVYERKGTNKQRPRVSQEKDKGSRDDESRTGVWVSERGVICAVWAGLFSRKDKLHAPSRELGPPISPILMRVYSTGHV